MTPGDGDVRIISSSFFRRRSTCFPTTLIPCFVRTSCPQMLTVSRVKAFLTGIRDNERLVRGFIAFRPLHSLQMGTIQVIAEVEKKRCAELPAACMLLSLLYQQRRIIGNRYTISNIGIYPTLLCCPLLRTAYLLTAVGTYKLKYFGT